MGVFFIQYLYSERFLMVWSVTFWLTVNVNFFLQYIRAQSKLVHKMFLYFFLFLKAFSARDPCALEVVLNYYGPQCKYILPKFHKISNTLSTILTIRSLLDVSFSFESQTYVILQQIHSGDTMARDNLHKNLRKSHVSYPEFAHESYTRKLK